MTFLTELWLPIVLSAVFVFIASCIFHVALPIHKSDVRKLPGEDPVLEAMRASGVGPGAYLFPCAASMKEMSSPEMIAKLKQGPVGWMTVLPPGGFNMNRSLVLWFAYTLLIGVLVAYVGWHALGGGAGYLAVFRIVGVTAILGYAVGYFHDWIWKGCSMTTTLKFIFDGVVYALLTAGTFGWLWPEVG